METFGPENEILLKSIEEFLLLLAEPLELALDLPEFMIVVAARFRGMSGDPREGGIDEGVGGRAGAPIDFLLLNILYMSSDISSNFRDFSSNFPGVFG